MSLARCVVAAVIGGNSMRTSWRTTEPKGIEDHLKELCLIYRGEIDNPHDVNALMDDASVARKIYDFAVRKKLERVKELGIDLTSVYERFIR